MDLTLKASHLSLMSNWNYGCVLPCSATIIDCVSLQVHMCVCGGGQRSTSGVVPQDLSILFIETGCLIRTWNSPFRLGWLGREPQTTPCLWLSSSGITNMYHHTWLFYVGSGD